MIAHITDIPATPEPAFDLPQSVEILHSIFQNAVEGIFQSTPDGRYLLVNPALARMYGYASPADMIADVQDISHSIYVDSTTRDEFKRLMARDGEVRGLEYQVRRRDGTIFWVSEHARAVRDTTGQVLYYEGFIEDISPRKQMEEQLRQALKMEAIGQLAGGVAHDFNNILTAILGYAELLQRRAPTESVRRHAEEIHKNTNRAADLCRQLLAFSRKQTLRPIVLNLNHICGDMDKMLQRVIGENIKLSTNIASDLSLIKADASQIEQVILNLAVNARDAMPGGGTLTIETANVTLDATYCANYPGLAPGPYVLLSVADTGLGMSPEVKARIFEPFFTTKPAGKGTGLGLATCYGVVKQSGGHINVYSEVGRGTVFKVYLPAVVAEEATAPRPAAAAPLATGHETILLAEDETAIREITALALRESGYTVLEAADGAEAMRLAQSKGCRHIDLLLTDVVMPEMGGKELAYWLRTVAPQTRVLFTSGYTDRSVISSGALNPGTRFLQKPYPLTALVQQVRAILDN